MIKFLICRPIAVFMTVLGFVLLGIYSSFNIPISLMPDIPIPIVNIHMNYSNGTAREIENNIVRPLRNQLLQTSNLLNINSEAGDGYATIRLELNYNTDSDLAIIEVNEIVDTSLRFLPRDLERPKVIKASATDIPIFNLVVSLNEDYTKKRFLELSEFSEEVLKKRIEQLPDIAIADISGLMRPEILIIPDIQKLETLGIEINELINSIKINNLELGNLLVSNGTYQYNFKLGNPLNSISDIENIYLRINNKLFQLKDLAKVKLDAARDKGMIYLNGERALVLAIIKQSDARIYELKKSLEKVIQSFMKDYPDLKFTTIQDQTKLLQLSINNLKSSLYIASFLAIIIMFLFLRDIKLSMIIALSIPFSLLASIFLIRSFNLSINIISLSGLILSVGLMIDNSIIVIDNIQKKIENGKTIDEACIVGTSEIITPLISSVLTTCSVFFPLLFLSGLTGALFYDQALTVAIGLSISLLISIFFIPVLFKQLKNKKFILEKWFLFNSKQIDFNSIYQKGFDYFFKRKIFIFSFSTVSIFLAFFLIKLMPYSQLPRIDTNEVIFTLNWNENVNLVENHERIRNIFDDLREVKTIYSQIGDQQFLLEQGNIKNSSDAIIYVETNDVQEIEYLKNNFQNKIQKQYPNAIFSIKEPKNIFQYLFGDQKDKLIVQIYSKESLEVPPEDELDEINYLINKSSELKIPLHQIVFIEILDENVLLYDVSYDDLIGELRTLFNQNLIDNLKTNKKFIPIKLDYNIDDFGKMIDESFVKNQNNETIAIRNLIKIFPREQYTTISANRYGEFLPFNIKTNNIENYISTIKNTFNNQNKYIIRFVGSHFDIMKLSSELLFVVLVSILLLYFILAAQFESLLQPFIILLEIPIDIGGALLLLWLFGGTINVMAVIGIVVMSGVIINDSILKIHTINSLRKNGHDIKKAIRLGGKLRLKPILMTSLTTILALLPFLFMSGLGVELQKPLALTVIGGMIIGTFISLYFIPIMYSFIHKS